MRSPCAEWSARRRKKSPGGRQWKKSWRERERKKMEERMMLQVEEKRVTSTEKAEEVVYRGMESAALG